MSATPVSLIHALTLCRVTACRIARSGCRLVTGQPARAQARVVTTCGGRKSMCTFAPAPEDSPAVSPKVRKLVDEISQLNLLEVSELCKVLKTELNIADAAPMAYAPAAAMGGAPAAAPAADAGEADAAPADAGPLLVTVTLKAFKDDKKVGVIKEIKRIMAETDPKFNLAAAKKFVESLPQKVKESVTRADADKLKEALEAAGGELEIA